jgi:hypothetical protein
LIDIVALNSLQQPLLAPNDSSAPASQDFSVLLTELIQPVTEPEPVNVLPDPASSGLILPTLPAGMPPFVHEIISTAPVVAATPEATDEPVCVCDSREALIAYARSSIQETQLPDIPSYPEPQPPEQAVQFLPPDWVENVPQVQLPRRLNLLEEITPEISRADQTAATSDAKPLATIRTEDSRYRPTKREVAAPENPLPYLERQEPAQGITSVLLPMTAPAPVLPTVPSPLPVKAPVEVRLREAMIPMIPVLKDSGISIPNSTVASAELAPPAAAGLVLRDVSGAMTDPLFDPQPAARPLHEAAAFPYPVLEDLKKYEITVRHETVKPADPQPPQTLQQHVVTADTIANIQQAQVPPRLTGIQNPFVLPKPPERPKTAPEPTAEIPSTPLPAAHLGNPSRAVETIEQAEAAHPVEIPDVPKFQVVRTVSMELGEPSSQVTIRIEDRRGGMAFYLGAGNEMLHRTIESSVASLVHALKREQIQVSNVEVFRKSPIEKVRRMKEAH